MLKSLSAALAALAGFALAPTLAAADPDLAPAQPQATLELAQSGGDDDRPLFDEDRLNEETREAIRQFLELIEPALMQFQALIQDLPAYEAPEILPNGDIIIRRKRGWGGDDESDRAPKTLPKKSPKSDERTKT